MDRGAWWATVHGVSKSQIQLSDYAQTSETLLEKGPVLYVGSGNFVERTALPWQDSLGSSGPQAMRHQRQS